MDTSNNTTVTSTKPTKKTVGDPIPQYFSLRNTWERSRAVLNGQAGVKAYDDLVDCTKNILIPFGPSMDQEQYTFYKAEAELPGLVAQYAKVLVGGLLRKHPQFTLPKSVPEDEAKEWLTNSFGADGNSMLSVMDSALWEELQTSRAWVLIDHPTVSEAELAVMSTEQRKQLNPYCVLFKPENVINWRVGKVPTSPTRVLTKFTVRMYEEAYTVDNPHHPDLVDTVIDYYLDQLGNAWVQRYTSTSGDQVKVVNGVVTTNFTGAGEAKNWIPSGEPVQLLMQGEPIPFLPVFPLNGSLEGDEPALQPLIDREIGLYNKVSRRNHLLYGAATYTPYVASDMSEDDFKKVVESGLGSWIHLQKGETAGAIETPSKALNDYDVAIKATIDEMARMGIRMLSPDGSSAESGVSLEIRNASQTAQLGLLNAKVSKTMQQIIGVMLRWKYGKDIDLKDLKFTLSEDFNPTPIGADWLRLTTEWYEKGFIPRSLFIDIGKHNDIIPTEYDDTAGIKEIQSDTLINHDRTTVDTSLVE